MPLGSRRSPELVVFESKRRRDHRKYSFENLEVRVVPTFAATATSLVESFSTGSYGTSVTFTATVTSAGVPTGTVTFEDGTTVLGNAPLSGGVATFSTNSLAGGTHQIVAYYGGSGGFNASASAGVLPSSIISTATGAGLNQPYGVVFDQSGNMYIASAGNNIVRKVTPAGVVSTYAGNGTSGYAGDGGPATSAELNYPIALAINASGDLFIADSSNNAVREVTPSGIISTVAGTGTSGYTGNGGPATSAELSEPAGLLFDASGDLLIADSNNNVIRKVTPSGIISTIVGNHTSGYTGDGGPATSAELAAPYGMAFDAAGNLFFADASNNVIRKVTPSGVISTVVGTGTAGYTGDGMSALTAELHYPESVSFDTHGNMFIADTFNSAIREVSSLGVISTVSGNGTQGYSGDGGPASSATLHYPSYMALNSSGSLFIADTTNNVVREITATPPLSYTVSAVPSTVSLAVTATAQSTTFSVTVATNSGPPPNGGEVSFYDGTTLLGMAPVVDGVAVFNYSALTPGTHNMSAVFSGSPSAAQARLRRRSRCRAARPA